LLLLDPVGDGFCQRRRLLGFALASIFTPLPPQMVADGALGDAEGLGNLRVGLPMVFENL
jgi:hypothetical protein